MRVYITEYEAYPLYTVRKKFQGEGFPVDIPEDKVKEWRKIIHDFYQAQREMEAAIAEQEIKEEELKHLKACFKKKEPSRTDKGYVLQTLGWIQIDTSLWEKDNVQRRLHEAYDQERCRFNELYPDESSPA